MAPRSKTHEEFVAQMAQVAPGVEVLGAYVNARTGVACRCRTCGFEWEGVPNHLLRGTGCPQCAGTRHVDAGDFAARVAAVAPAVELLGSYVNARTRVACRCRVCGHEWSPYPKGLLQGNACPACAQKAAAERLAKSHAKAQQEDGM